MTWDEHAEGWDDDEAVRLYSRAAFESLVRLCDGRPLPLRGSRVCDFGCGTGLLTEKLSPLCEEIVAIDTSTRMIEVLDGKVERLGLSNVRTSASAIRDRLILDDGLPPDPFDFVVCSSVCAFLDDYPATVRTLAGMLRPGGLFVQWDWELDPTAEEPFGLTREQISETLSKAGLESVQVETAFKVAVGDQIMRPLMGTGQASRGT